MTLQLDWPPDVVARLTEEARQKGLSLDAYLLQTILQKDANGETSSDEADKRRRREQAAARIRELRKGVTLGPGLTIRDLINEGRRD
jgi:hypothetical protein